MTRVLSIDPSSSAIGWAILESETGVGVPRLIAARVLKMTSTQYKAASKDEKIAFMIEGIGQIAFTARVEGVTDVVIETQGERPVGKHKATGGVMYGRAIGACEYAFSRVPGVVLHRVDNAIWIGNKSKEDRASELTMAGLYMPKPGKRFTDGDSGFDKSDAIALGWWWLRRNI